MTITITIPIPERRIADLLCGALEGGSHYWIGGTTTEIGKGDGKPWGDEYTPNYIAAPFCTDGYLHIYEQERSHRNKGYKLTRRSLVTGLQRMATLYPHHFSDFLQATEDATTADVFLQLCLWKKLRYG